jgi:hypothetical protein
MNEQIMNNICCALDDVSRRERTFTKTRFDEYKHLIGYEYELLMDYDADFNSLDRRILKLLLMKRKDALKISSKELAYEAFNDANTRYVSLVIQSLRKISRMKIKHKNGNMSIDLINLACLGETCIVAFPFATL